MKTILTLLTLLNLAVAANAQSVIPATSYGAAYQSYGRTVRSVYWRLDRGRVYEFQKSGDGGLTWTHWRVWTVPPERFITPGDATARYPWNGIHWVREEILSQPGMALQRCVDWTDVPPASRPVF